MSETFDVVVVGGGQAGLAAGYVLNDTDLQYTILDESPGIGHAWRSRWASLRLFTVARYSALPGLEFPGDPEHSPTTDEVADYLEAYARHFSLPVRLGTRVEELTDDDGGFVLETSGGTYKAQQVIVATGAYQRPHVPSISQRLDSGVVQLHAAEYRNPDQLPDDGEVLVVGAGNSGVEIAEELSESRRVYLSVGSKLGWLPRRILGKSVHWWGERLGMIRAPVNGWYGRRVAASEGLIGTSVRQLKRRHGVQLRGRVVAGDGRRVVFADGSSLEVPVVVWATGYASDYRWIRLPVLDEEGDPIHRRGVTDVPGLYFLGLKFQHSAGSALIGWVEEDARFIVDALQARARHLA